MTTLLDKSFPKLSFQNYIFHIYSFKYGLSRFLRFWILLTLCKGTVILHEYQIFNVEYKNRDISEKYLKKNTNITCHYLDKNSFNFNIASATFYGLRRVE